MTATAQAQIAANAQSVLHAIAPVADTRQTPTIAMAQQWHRDLYDGMPRPHDHCAGEGRHTDASFPDLIGYEVQVGTIMGAPSAAVPGLLAQFEQNVQTAVSNSCTRSSASAPTFTASGSEIHPFANGNGRTARLWANWAALRYRLPPLVTVRPRPAHPYGAAALSSMLGDHTVMIAVMDQMLRDYLAPLE